MAQPTASQIQTLDKNIKSLAESLKRAKDLQRKMSRKERPKAKPASHSQCGDENMAFHAALQNISDATDQLADATTLGQTTYNAWQDCLNS